MRERDGDNDNNEEYDLLMELDRLESLREEMEELRVSNLGEIDARIDELNRRLDELHREA